MNHRNYYRIDNFTQNLLTGETKLELINSYDKKINAFSADNTVFFVDSNSQRVSVNMSSNDYTVVEQSEGWGVDWFATSFDGYNVYKLVCQKRKLLLSE